MIIDELFEGPQLCPECGGISFSDLILAEKKDACYYKVKASAKVWPSAYASGRLVQCRKKGAANYGKSKTEGVAEQQELDEKWSQKYKKSINCANPKGFSQRAHCAGRKKNEDVEESLGKQIHSTFQTMGDTFSDAHLAKGISYFLQGRHQEGENWLRGKIPPEAQAAVFGKLKTLQAQGGVDVNKNPSVQQYINDKLVPWVKGQIQQGVAETRRGQIPMSNLKPGETDNLEPENIAGFRALPAYKQGQAAQQKAGKQLIQKSPYTFQSDQDWAYRQGAFDAQQASMFANFGKSKPLTTEGGDVFIPNIKDTAEYRAGLATGKLPVPYPEGTQEYASYYKGVIDRASPTLAKVGEEVEPTDDGAFSTWSGGMRVSGPNAYEKARQLDLDSFAEGEQQKGADYRDPKEVDYDDEYDAMVARVKKLAGLGPMKTVYDPIKRVYRNMPTAQQPKK